MKKITIAIVLFLNFVLADLLEAHPHVFINAYAKFVFSSQKLKGVEIEWEFDEFFSSQIIQGCDVNKDKFINYRENNIVRNKFFKNLKNFNYFSFIWIDNKYRAITRVLNFKARIKRRNIMIYKFFVPVNSFITSNSKSVKLMFTDKSNFVAFYSKLNGLKSAGLLPQITKSKCNKMAQFQIVFKK